MESMSATVQEVNQLFEFLGQSSSQTKRFHLSSTLTLSMARNGCQHTTTSIRHLFIISSSLIVFVSQINSKERKTHLSPLINVDFMNGKELMVVSISSLTSTSSSYLDIM